MKLSKSRFVAGCQCLKRLYWQVHEPELLEKPGAAVTGLRSDDCVFRLDDVAAFIHIPIMGHYKSNSYLFTLLISVTSFPQPQLRG